MMRPIASTAVASMQNSRGPRQRQRVDVREVPVSWPRRSSAEYWHIGATMMRLGKLQAAQR